MFMVPTRQQNPHPGAQQKLVGRAEPSAALSGVSRHSGTAGTRAGMLLSGMGREPGQSLQCRLDGLLPPPSLPQWLGSAPSPLSPGLPGRGPAAPTQQRRVRRTRRRTSLLLYTNRAGIGTQCCPRQEGGRQTEREGDIREVLRTDCDSTEENTLQRQQSGARPAQCPMATLASKARHSVALPAATPARGRGVPAAPHAGSVSQKPAQMVPLPQPKAGAQFGGRHGRPPSHNCAIERPQPREEKGEEGQRQKGEGGGERSRE